MMRARRRSDVRSHGRRRRPHLAPVATKDDGEFGYRERGSGSRAPRMAGRGTSGRRRPERGGDRHLDGLHDSGPLRSLCHLDGRPGERPGCPLYPPRQRSDTRHPGTRSAGDSRRRPVRRPDLGKPGDLHVRHRPGLDRAEQPGFRHGRGRWDDPGPGPGGGTSEHRSDSPSRIPQFGPSKFFVVDPAANSTFGYGPDGSAEGSFALAPGATRRGCQQCGGGHALDHRRHDAPSVGTRA